MKTKRLVPTHPLALVPAALLASLSGLSAGEPVPAPAPVSVAASTGLDAEFHVGYNSDYIFRGQDLGGDLYEFGLDFAGGGALPFLGDLNWSAGMWYASIDQGRAAANNELDVYGEVSKSLNDVFSVALGVTNYSYFGGAGADDDIEPYAALGAELFGLSLGAAAYFDGSNSYQHDWYFEFTAGYEHQVMQNLSAGVDLVLGVYDDTSPTPADVDEVYFGVTGSLSYSVSENITVSPYVAATFAEGNYFFGGVSVGFSF